MIFPKTKKLFLNSYTGYLFLISLFIIAIATPLFQKGVFGDGILYTSVAFNLHKNLGTFWHQNFSNTSMSFFCEQPPLYFEALNIFYTIFGGNDRADRLFTCFLFVLSILLIHFIWRKLNAKTSKYNSMSWFVGVLLISVFGFMWSYCNQVIETMVVPISLAGFYVLTLLINEKNKIKYVTFFVLFIVVLICLILTKGIQSAFLLVTPLLLVFLFRSSVKKYLILGLSVLLAFSTLCFLLFTQNSGAQTWLDCYMNKRIVATFNHVGATTSNHLEIVFTWLSESLPIWIFFAFVAIYLKLKKKYAFALFLKNILANKTALWLFLISLSASLPLAVTLEQRGFYLVPSYPFLALSFCFAFKKYLFVTFMPIAKKHKRTWQIITYLFLAFSIMFFVVNHTKYKRNEEMLKDIETMKNIIPYGETIGIDKTMWIDFSLQSYLNRYNNNSAVVSDSCPFYIVYKACPNPMPPNYTKIKLETLTLDIYSKNK